MAESDNQHLPSLQSAYNAPSESGRCSSLVLASAILATVAALLADGYAVATGLLVLRALSIDCDC
jgi:hypothetical protein